MLMSLVGGALLTGLAFALSGPVWAPLFGTRTAELIEADLADHVHRGAGFGLARDALARSRLPQHQPDRHQQPGRSATWSPSAWRSPGSAGGRSCIGALVQTTLASLLLFERRPTSAAPLVKRAQRRIAGFGLPAALAGLVEVLFRNVDYAILAARLSAATTGIYYRAFNLGVVYQDKLSGVMVQVAYPVYSRTADKESCRAMHERAARVHAAIIFPALASLIVFAPVLVPFLFGSAWEPAVGPTQVLAGAGMAAAVLTGYSQVMLAIGRPRPLLLFNVGRLTLYAGVVLLTSTHGLIAVAVGVVATYVLILIGAYRLLLQRYVGIRLGRLIPELGPAIVGCLALVAVTLPLLGMLEGELPRVLLIALVAAAGLAVYALVLRIGFPAAWSDVRMLVVRVLGPLTRVWRARGGQPAEQVDAARAVTS